MTEQEFMHFIATKLFSKRQFENPFYIRMQPRGYGKTESRKRLLKEIVEENLRLQNSNIYQPGSIGVKIGLLKLRGYKKWTKK